MISAILSWPDSFDFPVFRKNLSLLQKHVDEVIICFTQHGNHPLKDWLRTNMSGCKFLDDRDAQGYGGDWRNKSTNYMIDESKGDWILSLEQDFFIKDFEYFFTTVKRAMLSYEAISFQQGNRFHPAFLLVTREALGKTNRDFSTNGVNYDHFAMISAELKGSCRHTTLENLGLVEGEEWLHLAGLTENYFSPTPYYRLPDFHVYNEACKEINPRNEYWVTEMNRCSGKAGEKISNIGDFI